MITNLSIDSPREIVPFTTADKIRAFQRLAPGWSYSNGEPVSQATVDIALALHQELAKHGFVETDAFPGLGGEVMLRVYATGKTIEFVVERSGTVSLFVESDAGDEAAPQYGLSPEQAIQKIEELKKAEWTSSECSIHFTTTPRSGDLFVWHSGTTGKVSLFSTSNAPLQPANIFVVTSHGSTAAFPELQRYFGSSPAHYYPTRRPSLAR